MLRYRRDYYEGTHWLHGTVALVVLLLIALGVLHALHEMQERAEKLTVELTTRYMQTGLKLAVAEELLRGRSAAVAKWVGRNPVVFLAAPPQGYKGACDRQDLVQHPPGVWCFDEMAGELRYRPRNQDNLRSREAAVPEGAVVLRWKVLLREKTGADVANIGAYVEILTPYTWID